MITDINSLSDTPVVVTVANDKFTVPLCVMLKSLEMNLGNEAQVAIYILNRALSRKNKDIIENSLFTNKLTITWVAINHKRLKGLRVDGHLTIDTYYRLLIEELFPQLDKVIYLDADLVINTSIRDLWKIDFKGYHLLAVPHASKKSGFVNGERGLPSFKVLGIPGLTRTFNAGVMVINLKLWRIDAISKMIFSYLRKHKELVLWHDQDGLNAILFKKWVALPAVWNVMTCHLESFSTFEDSLLTSSEYQQVYSDPAIIHFAGPNKPWLPNYEGPFQELFNQYYDLVSSLSINELLYKRPTLEDGGVTVY